MALGVLERLKMDQENLIPKTVYNGKLKVYNVPHASFPNGYGPDGEKEYLPADVMYKLTHIFRYMLDNKLTEMDFTKFE
ncbi:hypothetical protein [Cytobacillus oceanisediminis]|uniref:hypothetical protein n=1 Tax=Cytobacillus oceanisediminis TaxID=665099 RepID=UPI0011A377B4|nr:hypothetical protein [Cytobacillus oceanisediminis]